jgi:hypothetical protein
VLYSYYTWLSITRSMDQVTARMLLRCPPLHEHYMSYKHLPLSHGSWSLFCSSTIPYRPTGHYRMFLCMSLCLYACVCNSSRTDLVRMCSLIPPTLMWNFVTVLIIHVTARVEFKVVGVPGQSKCGRPIRNNKFRLCQFFYIFCSYLL